MSNIPGPVQARMDEMKASNPANAPERKVPKRVPLSVPTLTLEAPKIPGYKTYWFRGTGQRIQQAQRAGYEFVERDEIQLNEIGYANGFDDDGNTDLGTRVSVSAGDSGTEDGGLRMYLMKIREEHWEEDRKLMEEQQAGIAGQLRGDKASTESGMDASNRYTRGEQKRHMFQPRRT